MIVRGADLATITLTQVALLDNSLQLSHLDSVLILHPSKLSQVSILQDCVGFSKEIVDQKSELVPRSCPLCLLPVSVDQSVNTARYRVILQVGLVLAHEDAALAKTREAPLRLLGRILLAHQAGRVLTETHEAAPVHLASDAVSPNGLLLSVVVPSTFRIQGRAAHHVRLGHVVGGRILLVGDHAE